MQRTVKTWLGLAACLTPLLFQSGSADEDSRTVPVRCVDTMRIRDVDVVDNQNLLFHMVNGTIYHNRLSQRCPGLRENKAFMYSIPMHQLCNVDLITVLENEGFGFRRGASCGLGDFVPITKEAAKQMKAAAKRGSR